MIKNPGARKGGDLVINPTEAQMVGDTQPPEWGDIDVNAPPTCHDASQKRGDASQSDSDYSASGASDNADTDDDAWGAATDCPLEAVNQHLTISVREYARKTKSDSHCAMCPFRRPPKPWRLREHMHRYRTVTTNWCSSGGKKLTICVALRDSDKLPNPWQIAGRPNYLRRSASTIRANFGINGYDGDVKNNVSGGNLFDIDIRLSQYTRGPEIR